MHRTLWLVPLLAGCVKQVQLDPGAVLLDHLASADRLWLARAGTGLDAVREQLLAIPDELGADPRVRWRLARVDVAAGLVAAEPLEARRLWARARAEGAACAASRAGALGPSAYRDRATCAAWAGMAWARWLGSFGGHAAAVDEAGIRSLLAQARADGQLVLVTWAEALVEAALVEGEPAPDAARRALAQIVREGDSLGRDDVWVAWADLAALDEDTARGVIPQRPPRTPEERAVVARQEPSAAP